MEQCIGTSKDLIDYILVAGDTLGDKEQVLYVLGGLDTNYTSIVTTIITHKCYHWMKFILG